MAENNKEEKKGIRFKYIDNPDKILEKWDTRYEQFKEFGKIEYFLGFLCPICIAEMNIEERVHGEYATMEKLILKLYHNGIIEAQLLSELTGLNIEMIQSILSILEHSYGHIKDGVLTEDGLNSLETNVNIQRFETTRQIQIEGLTGCVLIPELSQTFSGDDPYYNLGQPEHIIKYSPSDNVIVNLKEDFADVLNQHQEYESGIFDRNIEMINSVEIEGNISAECFLVKYSFLPHPFLILPSQAARHVRWMPVAISKSNKEVLDECGIAFAKDAALCSDERMEKLMDVYQSNLFADEQTMKDTEQESYFEKVNPETDEIEKYHILDDHKKHIPVVRANCNGKVVYCEKI